jgi:hypothetical protein
MADSSGNGHSDQSASNGNSDGRDKAGRFAKGNKGGPGNPFFNRQKAYRTAILEAVTPEEVVAVMHTLIAKAQEGDVAAIKEVFDRTVGKSVPVFTDLVDALNDATTIHQRLRALDVEIGA